jgi:RNA polymerase sigma-70 factor (sigma-E family)
MRSAVRTEAESRAVSEGGRLEELYRRHGADAVRLAYLLTGSHVLSEDLVHEAFVRLFGKFRDLRDPGAFEWYLRRTVVNLVRSHYRRVRVERSYVERQGQDRTESPQPPDQGAHDELWRALLQLPERQRTAIVLRYYEDLSEARTAEVMACPVGTVKSLASRGMDRLRELMTRDELDE